MAYNSYPINTAITLSMNVTTAASVPVTPSTLTLHMRTPDGLVTDISASVTATGTGAYTATYTVAQVGLHQYQWTGTGAAQASANGAFMGLSSAF